MKVVVIGSSNTDMVIQVKQLPRPGETIMGDTFFMAAGGKGANQAVAAARAGGEVTLIAKVGNDTFGQQAIEGFKRAGINTDHILTDMLEPSGVAQIMVGENGENCIAVAPGSNMNLTCDDMDDCWSVIEAADYVLMQMEIPMETIAYVAKRLEGTNTKLILNPAPARRLDDQLISHLYLISPNETEIETLTGQRVTDLIEAEVAGRILLSKGVNNVIITLGSRGAILINTTGTWEVSGYKVTPVDTTAAGDVFNGALTVGLATGKDLSESIRFANAAAAISVTRSGAQPSAPMLREIEEFQSSFTD